MICDDGTEGVFSKFADDTQLWEGIDPKGHAAIQSDLNRLKNWADRNLKKFNKRKY